MTREPIDTQEHDYTYDDGGHDDEARTDALLNEFGVEGESLNDGTSNATATENDSPDDILTHEETLSNKLDLQLAHLKRRLNGEEVTIVAEAASNTKEDQQPTGQTDKENKHERKEDTKKENYGIYYVLGILMVD